MKCPGGAIGACQIDHNSKKGFNLGYVQSNPQIAANGELSLQYSGGSECHHQFNRSIRIVFSCSKIMVRAGITKCKCGERRLSWKSPITGYQGNNNPFGIPITLSLLYLKLRMPVMCNYINTLRGKIKCKVFVSMALGLSYLPSWITRVWVPVFMADTQCLSTDHRTWQ